MGRFLTRDTWAGGYNSPHSLNRWLYVDGKKVEYCHEKNPGHDYDEGPYNISSIYAAKGPGEEYIQSGQKYAFDEAALIFMRYLTVVSQVAM